MSIRLAVLPEYQPSAHSMAGQLFDNKSSLFLALEDLLKAPLLLNPYARLKHDSNRLADLLALYTVADLEKIHEQSALRLPHASRKANLIESLAVSLPLTFSEFLNGIEGTMAELLLSLLDGSVKTNVKAPGAASYLLKCGFIFQIDQADQAVLQLPLELARILEKRSHQEGWVKTIQRNTDICWMAANLLARCGTMHESVFLRYMEDLSKHLAAGQLDRPVHAIRARSSHFHGLPVPENCSTLARYVNYSSNVDKIRLDSLRGPVYYCHSHVLDPYNIIDEQKKRKGHYYPDFTCQELLADPALLRYPIGLLSRYLQDELDLPTAEAEYASAFWALASLNDPGVAHLELLISRVEFKTEQDLSDLLVFLNEYVFNNLPRWVLWGNSSHEFRLEELAEQAEVSWIEPQPEVDILAGQLALKPEDITKIRQLQPAGTKGSSSPGNIKTGRNEPCPCGSGKKYKKCCGR